MAPAGFSNKVSVRQSRAALKRVLDSGFFDSSPKLEKFLRFVVIEEIEGRGGEISAQAIAIGALGRPPSFDPRADPVVRVFAGRLRAALASYYEGPGRNDPVRIAVPKGSYRPSFRQVDTGMAGRRIRPEAPRDRGGVVFPVPSAFVLAGVFTLVLLVGGAGIHYVIHYAGGDHHPETAELPQAAPAEMPIVEILPFDAGADDIRIGLVEGIRQQLIVDLSQFRAIKVRAVPAALMAGAPPTAAHTSDYQVSGKVVAVGNSERIFITVRDMASGAAIWSEPIGLPTNDAEYQQLLVTAVRSIVTQLASISGLLQTEAFRRLEERRTSLGNAQTSEYECIMDFYAYDRTKSPELQTAVHRCLSALTAAGSRNSTVWSSWALMLYLDWTRHAGPDDRTGLDTALAASRQAIELDPTDASGHEYQAAILRSMGEFDAAVQASEIALALNPSKPDLYVHLGWHHMLAGDWTAGTDFVREGVAMNPRAPGWMRIPLSLDAFDRGDYSEAFEQAREIIESGDSRGIVLALAAAIAMGETDTARMYFDDFRSVGHTTPEDPMREIRNLFPDPELIAKYEAMLARMLAG